MSNHSGSFSCNSPVHVSPFETFECLARNGYPRIKSVMDKVIASILTLVGRFLRFTHIDELPQLVNVLRGEMSLVGPRPERPTFVDQLEKALPRYRERLMVPPGITGLAQVQLKPDTDLSSVASKLICDLHYIQNMSVWRDL